MQRAAVEEGVSAPQPVIQAFFDEATNSVSYLVGDSGEAAIIDAVLGFDPVSGAIDHGPADARRNIVEFGVRFEDPCRPRPRHGVEDLLWLTLPGEAVIPGDCR